MKRTKLDKVLATHYAGVTDVVAQVAQLAQENGQMGAARILSQLTGENITQFQVNRLLKRDYECVVEVRYVPRRQRQGQGGRS
jgi:hypothetical protein